MEPSEGEETVSAEDEASYPLRCSFTITKVRTRSTLFYSSSSDKQYVAFYPRCIEHRCHMSRGRVRARERVVLQGF